MDHVWLWLGIITYLGGMTALVCAQRLLNQSRADLRDAQIAYQAIARHLRTVREAFALNHYGANEEACQLLDEAVAKLEKDWPP